MNVIPHRGGVMLLVLVVLCLLLAPARVDAISVDLGHDFGQAVSQARYIMLVRTDSAHVVTAKKNASTEECGIIYQATVLDSVVNNYTHDEVSFEGRWKLSIGSTYLVFLYPNGILSLASSEHIDRTLKSALLPASDCKTNHQQLVLWPLTPDYFEAVPASGFLTFASVDRTTLSGDMSHLWLIYQDPFLRLPDSVPLVHVTCEHKPISSKARAICQGVTEYWKVPWVALRDAILRAAHR